MKDKKRLTLPSYQEARTVLSEKEEVAFATRIIDQTFAELGHPRGRH